MDLSQNPTVNWGKKILLLKIQNQPKLNNILFRGLKKNTRNPEVLSSKEKEEGDSYKPQDHGYLWREGGNAR